MIVVINIQWKIDFIKRNFCFISVPTLCQTATAQDVARLQDTLFRDYRKSIRPVRNQHDAVHVNISLKSNGFTFLYS
jgi:hypothetical protein